MTIKHPVEITKVVGAKAVETGDYYTIEIEVVTPGNVTKVLRIPHDGASWLAAEIGSELSAMTDEQRSRSFFASIRRV